jgi:chromosome segregation ATPase
MEELTWLNTKNFHRKNSLNINNNNLDGNDLSDLMNSYQQKISFLNNEVSNLKQDINDRDKEISQLRTQYNILKQRSRSVDRNSNSSDDNGNRIKRGVSVDGGGNLREQLEASSDEIRLLKNKLLRLEDELNNSVLEKETLLGKLDEQSKQGMDDTINKNLQIFTNKIGRFSF